MKKEESRPYFPMFVNLWDMKIVIVGGGNIARRRLITLLHFSNQITVLAPDNEIELQELAKINAFNILQKSYEQEDILEADMVIAATNNHEVNNQIYSVCKCMGILVNVCSDRKKCDFYFPSVIKEGNMVVGVTASGTDHHKVKALTEHIKKTIEWEV